MTVEPAKLLKALDKRLKDKSLVLDDPLRGFIKANSTTKIDKLSRTDLEAHCRDRVRVIDYTKHLPQSIPLTAKFMEDVIEPVASVLVETGRYRVTMRKLLRLSLIELQQQAELMEIDTTDLDEEGIASLILINLNEESEIGIPLAHMLLAKEIANVYGVRFVIPIRGHAHPSSTVAVTIKPVDMIQYLQLSKKDLFDECQNQGIAVNPHEKKPQLAIRLVAWWNEHPHQLREPFTPNFADFLLERARNVR